MDLVGYLLDLLPENERQAIETELEVNAELRAQLESLRSTLVPLAADGDVDPPAGMANRVIAASRDPVVMSIYRRECAPASPVRFVDVALVAGVLLVAALLVLPAIASARRDEARLRCADQLRQVGVALRTYQDIERGALPGADPLGPLNHAGVFSLLLQAQGLLPEAKILICPSADSAIVLVPRLTEYLATPAGSLLRELQRRDMGGSYGYSLGFEEDGVYHAPSQESSWTPIVSDRPPRESDREADGNSPNHGGAGQNVLFADGHVSWLGEARLGMDGLFENAAGTSAAGQGQGDAVIGVSEAVPFPRGR